MLIKLNLFLPANKRIFKEVRYWFLYWPKQGYV